MSNYLQKMYDTLVELGYEARGYKKEKSSDDEDDISFENPDEQDNEETHNNGLD